MTGNLFESQAPQESTSEWFIAHCDGGSRGNPGPSGYGAVVEDAQGQVVARLSQFLGIQTNNYAEYSGLLAVLALVWGIAASGLLRGTASQLVTAGCLVAVAWHLSRPAGAAGAS